MLNLFSGEFSYHQAPLEYSGNKCTNRCGYCFVDFKGKKMTSTLNSCVKSIQNPNENTLLGKLILEKYPICLSNNTDPFTSVNMPETSAFCEILKHSGNGVYFQTKGGDIDRIMTNISKIKEKLVYISITAFDDSIRKRIEPTSPSIENRLKLAEILIKEKIQVTIAVNPILPEWFPFSDFQKFIEKLNKIGAKDIMFQPLHLSKSIAENWSTEKIDRMGIERLKEFGKRKGELFDYVKKCMYYAATNKMETFSFNFPLISNYMKNQMSAFKKCFPSSQLFYNIVMENGAKEYHFEDYYNIMSVGNEKLFQTEFPNLLNYVWKFGRHSYIDYVNKNTPKTFKDLFKIIWNDGNIFMSPQKNPLLILKTDEKNKAILDENNNAILFHDGNAYGKDIKRKLFYSK